MLRRFGGLAASALEDALNADPNLLNPGTTEPLLRVPSTGLPVPSALGSSLAAPLVIPPRHIWIAVGIAAAVSTAVVLLMRRS